MLIPFANQHKWTYSIDNGFAKSLFDNHSWNFPSDRPGSGQLCVTCNDFDHFDRHLSISELRTTAVNCQLCDLLLKAMQRFNKRDLERIHIFKSGSALIIGEAGPPVLRLCSDIAIGAASEDIQIGFPVLPEATHPIRFDLLRAWLRRCDEEHECKFHDPKLERVLPTRLLFVGNPNLDILSICTTTQLGDEDYIALSHCWGELSEDDKEKIGTTKKNISSRQKKFSLKDMPRTFQDAIQVTRELGRQYLWIDSLCILQGDAKDWEHEAKRMEDVFSSAYCVIAASSASNSYKGFLQREIGSRYVQITDASGRQIYACADMDDLENDVNKSLLNTRGWVLQERALSRRTVHFTTNQMYWECGEGVCCENLNVLQVPKWGPYFLIDPKFPQRLLEAGDERTVHFINALFEDYSNRGLTKSTDRAIAISGLQTRIARTLDSQESYGILDKYRWRNLLWQRCGEKKMEHIKHTDLKVPSWSWTAYLGGITFISIPFDQNVYWHEDLRLDSKQKDTLTGSLGKLWDCTLKQKESQLAIQNRQGRERGWLQFDVEDITDIDLLRCVVVGRTQGLSEINYYVLVVRKTGSKGEYERVGVGLIWASYIVIQIGRQCKNRVSSGFLESISQHIALLRTVSRKVNSKGKSLNLLLVSNTWLETSDKYT